MIVVSHVTTAPEEGRLTGLTYATVTTNQRLESRRSWDGRDVLGSAVVLALIVVAYVYFNG